MQCRQDKNEFNERTIYQYVESNDTVWVRPSGTQLIMDRNIKLIDISDYSITGRNELNKIYLEGGFNNLEPGVARLSVQLENDSIKTFVISLSKTKGTFFAVFK